VPIARRKNDPGRGCEVSSLAVHPTVTRSSGSLTLVVNSTLPRDSSAVHRLI
jgi:hypothetical protein